MLAELHVLVENIGLWDHDDDDDTDEIWVEMGRRDPRRK